MRSSARNRIDDWRQRLSPYGQPAVVPPPVPQREPRSRRAGAGVWLVALGLGAGVAALVVSNQHDPRSLGTQLDDAIGSVRGLGSEVGRTVADSGVAAADASRQALAGVSTAIDDSAISLKVKTALAADPALSAARIEVSTRQGVVRLDGPAPDAVARERATVLAGAPQGVRGVDNRLTLPQASRVVAVAEGVPRSTEAAPADAPR